MPQLILTEQQVRILSDATEPVEFRDAIGNLLIRIQTPQNRFHLRHCLKNLVQGVGSAVEIIELAQKESNNDLLDQGMAVLRKNYQSIVELLPMLNPSMNYADE